MEFIFENGQILRKRRKFRAIVIEKVRDVIPFLTDFKILKPKSVKSLSIPKGV